MDTSPSPAPTSVFILPPAAAAPHADNTRLVKATSETKKNHLVFITLSLLRKLVGHNKNEPKSSYCFARPPPLLGLKTIRLRRIASGYDLSQLYENNRYKA